MALHLTVEVSAAVLDAAAGIEHSVSRRVWPLGSTAPLLGRGTDVQYLGMGQWCAQSSLSGGSEPLLAPNVTTGAASRGREDGALDRCFTPWK